MDRTAPEIDADVPGLPIALTPYSLPADHNGRRSGGSELSLARPALADGSSR